MKTILLINPKQTLPPVAPLGLEYISSFLSERGHNVVIYDMNIHEESLSSVIENIIPNCVGISVRNINDSCYATAEFFLDKVKALVSEVKKKGVPVIMGGGGFSVMPHETFIYTGAGAGMRGDGEEV